jgi:hypothetical protein
MIHFAYPSCGKHLEVADHGASKEISCVCSGQWVVIPRRLLPLYPCGTLPIQIR